MVTSYMLRYECGQNPYEMRRKAIMQFVDLHTVAYVGLERGIRQLDAGDYLLKGLRRIY